MTPYGNRHGRSGVRAYALGPTWIDIWFGADEEPYRYSYATAGRAVIEEMKGLARAGKGLSTYVARRAPAYERKPQRVS
jgi:hypothetical protein